MITHVHRATGRTHTCPTGCTLGVDENPNDFIGGPDYFERLRTIEAARVIMNYRPMRPLDDPMYREVTEARFADAGATCGEFTSAFAKLLSEMGRVEREHMELARLRGQYMRGPLAALWAWVRA